MHHFRLYEGKYWCENEDVISEECTDYDRCNNECVCNHTVEYSCCECGSQDHTCNDCSVFMEEEDA
jgi:hypothetical protein